jgi:hypothetical protein
VHLLIIELVRFADFKLIRLAIDHESDAWVGGDWNVNAVTAVK